ncbi:MAG: M15 family metallopeptidase [Acidimicrobiales bacterium]
MDYSAMSSPTAGLDIPIPIPTSRSVPPTAGTHPPGGELNRDDAAGDELVDAGRELRCLACYHAADWPGTSATTWLRAGVVRRLADIESRLPSGFGLAIFDGWRSMETVRALYAHYYGPGSTLEPGYLADPDAAGVPPHLTGGAVDLTLSWQGVPLSLGTAFDEFTPRAAADALELGEETVDRDLRRFLRDVMTTAGFAPYAEEWWHFSWGDDDWARWSGADSALYGATAPTR